MCVSFLATEVPWSPPLLHIHTTFQCHCISSVKVVASLVLTLMAFLCNRYAEISPPPLANRHESGVTLLCKWPRWWWFALSNEVFWMRHGQWSRNIFTHLEGRRLFLIFEWKWKWNFRCTTVASINQNFHGKMELRRDVIASNCCPTIHNHTHTSD